MSCFHGKSHDTYIHILILKHVRKKYMEGYEQLKNVGKGKYTFLVKENCNVDL